MVVLGSLGGGYRGFHLTSFREGCGGTFSKLTPSVGQDFLKPSKKNLHGKTHKRLNKKYHLKKPICTRKLPGDENFRCFSKKKQ